jgi:hypothetical protein
MNRESPFWFISENPRPIAVSLNQNKKPVFSQRRQDAKEDKKLNSFFAA